MTVPLTPPPETPPGVTPPPGNAPPPATMPEGLPVQFWDQQSGQVNLPDFVKSYGEVSAFKTEHEARVAALPKTPEDYKIEAKLPDTVKLPDGVQFKIDEKDPRIPAVRAFAHKHRLPQDAVNDLVALEAQRLADDYVASDAEIQAEFKKLGENGKTRIEAANAYLKANFSEAEHSALREYYGNAMTFGALEKLIAKATSQSIPPNLNGGNSEPVPPKPRPADVFYGKQKVS